MSTATLACPTTRVPTCASTTSGSIAAAPSRTAPRHRPAPTRCRTIVRLGLPTPAVTLRSPVLSTSGRAVTSTCSVRARPDPLAHAVVATVWRHVGAEALHQGLPACGKRHVGIGTPAPGIEGGHQHDPAGPQRSPDDDGARPTQETPAACRPLTWASPAIRATFHTCPPTRAPVGVGTLRTDAAKSGHRRRHGPAPGGSSIRRTSA